MSRIQQGLCEKYVLFCDIIRKYLSSNLECFSTPAFKKIQLPFE